MSYCINPQCSSRDNPDDLERCLNCNSSLIINERYRLIRPLRRPNRSHVTEIFEIDNLGTVKILKVLTSERQRLIELFQQEAELLKQFQGVAVPRVDAYFVFSLDNGSKLYCLVMEKIDGEDLLQWIAQNNPPDLTLAIDWLRQLGTILQQVHQVEVLHRDIKPSNIMICPNGQLKLIDFGTARKITNTYVEKLKEGELTRVYSLGYTPPEQIAGKAGYQSDFFALGRTMIHLLTGVSPNDLPRNEQTQQLLWRDRAPQVSSWFADLIDRLMQSSPEVRIQKSQFIFEQLALNEHQQPAKSIFNRDRVSYKLSSSKAMPFGLSRLTGLLVESQSAKYSDRCQTTPRTKNIEILQSQSFLTRFLTGIGTYLTGGLHQVLCLSLAIALLIIGIRHLGLIQPMELQAFDRLMVLRPLEVGDRRLLIVTIDERDIQYQDQMKMPMRWSLSDTALLQLLQKLEPYQPRTIGLDIYRDFSVTPSYTELAQRLRSDERFFALCKVPSPQDGAPNGNAPPPEVPQSRLGFSDFVADDIEIIRRHLIHLTPAVTSPCGAQYAFNFQLAAHYLQQEGFRVEVTPQGELKIGEVVLHRLNNHTSGYQKIDATGYQILLNYRSLRSPTDIAQQVSLKDVLNDQINPELASLIKDSIVIIGDIAASGKDSWVTPYSGQAIAAEKQVPGVTLQANMVSQILSAVLDQRPLLGWWSRKTEYFWIILWSAFGGAIAWGIRSPFYLGLATLCVISLLFTCCFVMLTQATWIPLIPPLLAFSLAQITVLSIMRSSYFARKQRTISE